MPRPEPEFRPTARNPVIKQGCARTEGLVKLAAPRYRGDMCWIIRSGLLAAGLLLAGPDTTWAAVPPLPAAASVAQAAPVLKEGVDLAGHAAEIPIRAAEILNLPRGVVECVFWPLPGVSFRSGLAHLGTGLLAPFRLVEAVVTLPYDTVQAVGHVTEPVTGMVEK